MLILAAGDFHGKFDWLPAALDHLSPDLLICPGDWGDPGEVSEATLAAILQRVHTLTITGNHDDRALLSSVRNRDGSPALLEQGEARTIGNLVVAGISGIWAKTRLGSRLTSQWEAAQRRRPDLTLEEWLAGRPLPPYITDEEVAAWSTDLAGRGVDILITHGCPVGIGDRTPAGGRGGNRCFRQALATVQPRIHLCGHLHRLQREDLPEGRAVLNSGSGAAREGWLIRWERSGWKAEPLAG